MKENSKNRVRAENLGEKKKEKSFGMRLSSFSWKRTLLSKYLFRVELMLDICAFSLSVSLQEGESET